MFKTHRYYCPQCKLQSDPFASRNAAEECGNTHRLVKHEGMHPEGEGIIPGSSEMPTGGEWKAVALVIAFLLVGLISKLF